MIGKKRYLGDGVFVEWDGFHFVLTTETGNGIATNTIYFEWEMVQVLFEFRKAIAEIAELEKEKK